MIKEAERASLFPDEATPKALGAFYTDSQVADFLVWWAVRSKQDRVLDPSFGGGVFLRSACIRLKQLGGEPGAQAMGIEIDADVHARTSETLAEEFGIRGKNLLLADFFILRAIDVPAVEAVVGNPPFIRYQRFSGETRKKALASCAGQGVRLPQLCSSWAPFVVHSTAMLRPGGRLAMVVPMEIAHASYARPVLRFLCRSFGKTTFLTFKKKLFPSLSEDTLLLLAEQKGRSSSDFLWRDFSHADQLLAIKGRDRRAVPGTRRLDANEISDGRARLVESFISSKARALYRELKRSPLTRRLGTLADVGIGYVTGANKFFHLTPDQARRWGIPRQLLKSAVFRGRALSGLRFTQNDWQRKAAEGESGYLLHIEEQGGLSENVWRYLSLGEDQGVSKTYKCSNRSPWFRVPHVYKPDAFLSYMSGATPHLAANEAEAVAPNSLHIVRLRQDSAVSSAAIAALWQTSLTRLSAEIEGHALGGGMLKIEPTEAENVVLPWPSTVHKPWLEGLADDLDGSIRRGDLRAMDLADAMIMREGLGLNQTDCNLLRSAADSLRDRRYSRSAPL